MTSRSRPPAPLVVAQVLTVGQVLGVLVVAVGGGLLAAGSGAGGSGGAWSGLVVTAGVGLLVVGLTAGVVLGVPLLLLRGSSPTRRTTGRGLLVGAELLLLVPPLVVVHVRSGTVVPLGTDPPSLVLDALLLVPVVVIGCLLLPSVGRWAEPARASTVGAP